MSDKLASTTTLPLAVLDVIEQYTRLSIDGKQVIAPYYMNEPGRKGRRVSVGKGTAQALERETLRLAKKYKFDLRNATSGQIHEFMVQHRLGIDCSGLVAWASHALAMQRANRSLWRSIIFNGNPLRISIIRHLRAIENISARLLTNDSNAETISLLHEVQPGDIIRSLNGNHVLLITEIGYDKRKNPLYFKYVNSTEFGGIKYGVRYGLIKISEPTGHILAQQWVDGEGGVNWIFNAANNFPEDTRIVRLRVLRDSK